MLTAALLGVIQGLTEFLPVSSSTAHLIIGARLFRLGATESAGVHVLIQLGSILAVMWLYSGRRSPAMLRGAAVRSRLPSFRAHDPHRVPAGGLSPVRCFRLREARALHDSEL